MQSPVFETRTPPKKLWSERGKIYIFQLKMKRMWLENIYIIRTVKKVNNKDR